MSSNTTENLNETSKITKSSTRRSSTHAIGTSTATTTYFPFILGEQRIDHGSDVPNLNYGSKLYQIGLLLHYIHIIYIPPIDCNDHLILINRTKSIQYSIKNGMVQLELLVSLQ